MNDLQPGRITLLLLIVPGAGFIFVQSLVHVPIVHSDWFLEGARYVAGLIRYR